MLDRPESDSEPFGVHASQQAICKPGGAERMLLPREVKETAEYNVWVVSPRFSSILIVDDEMCVFSEGGA